MTQHNINLDRWRKQPGSTQHSGFSQNQTQVTAENAEWQTVVTEDYKVVKVASYVINNLKQEVRKQMGVPPDWAQDEEKIAYHRRQLALLEKANAAPRCQHIYADGTRCRGPKLREGKKCYAHERMEASRAERLGLPVLEDANSVVLAVMEIQRALLDGEISEKTAGLLLYSVQIGAWAVQRVTFRETEPEEMVRVRPAVSTQQSAVSKNRERIHRGDRRRGEKTRGLPQRTRKGAEETQRPPAGAPVAHESVADDNSPAQPGAAPTPAHEACFGDPGAAVHAASATSSPGMNGVSPIISGMKGEG